MAITHLSLIGVLGRKRTITAKEEAVSIPGKVFHAFTTTGIDADFTVEDSGKEFVVPSTSIDFTAGE